AQVKTGGGGKTGGGELGGGAGDTEAKARQDLGGDNKGDGRASVLVAGDTDIAQEYYLSFLIDRADRTFLSMCSVQGGVEIEEVARTSPDALARIAVSPLAGVDAATAAEIVA